MKKLLLISIFLISLKEAYAAGTSENIVNPVNIIKKEPTRINIEDFLKKIDRFKRDKEMIGDMSKDIKAQDDFYEAVNEKWRSRTELPPTKPAWGAFTELNEKNQDFTKGLITELKKKKASALNGDEKKILILYNSFYDMKKRDSQGYTPLKGEFSKIDSIKNVKDFQAYNIEMTKKGKRNLYGWAVGRDLNNSRNNGIYLTSGGLGLSREYYQKETEENSAVLLEYTKYVGDLLTYAGEKNVDERAKRVVEFEKNIAKTLLTNEESHDVKKYNNPRKVSELSNIVKNINLADYLNKVGVNTENVIIDELKYYENMDSLITDENMGTIRDYLKVHMLINSASVLTDQLGKRTFEFYGKYLNGQKEREILEKRALYFINNNLGELIGKEYVKRNFSEEAKKDTEEMVEYIIKAFRIRIEKLSWMGPETKQKALEKLEKFTVKIGYPDKWHDYSTLVLNDKDSLYANMDKIIQWSYNEDMKKVGKPVDKKEWFMNPHEINAYYSPTGNEIVFPAGILQFPFYDLKLSSPGSNFGAIGVVIGHEVTHGFDISGANFDGDGNVKDWWTKEDRKNFEAITKKLSEEYSKYSVAPNTFINGEYTLTENIADLGGVNIAYDALLLYLKDHPEKAERINGYTQSQLFFMSFARVWRQKATEEYLKNLVKSDSHSPAYFRVNGTLINVDGFHQIFKTQKENKLYKAPKDRIKIW